MTSDNAAAGVHEPPVFSARLRPHRSLTPHGRLAVVAAIGGTSLTVGTFFWGIGAWPVIGFMGLDVALVWLAFRLNERAARSSEEIRMTRDRLTVRKIAADGRAAETRFVPYWARLEIERRPQFGIVRMRIASHGNRLDVGGFLPLPEREGFASAFAAALATVRAMHAA